MNNASSTPPASGGATSIGADWPNDVQHAPLPEGWLRKRSELKLRLGSIALLITSGVLIATAILEADAWKQWIAAAFLAGVGIAGIGLSASRSLSKRVPRLANAMDFTNSVAAPADSWVHFAPLRALRWPTLISLSIFGVMAAALAVVVAVMAPVPNDQISPFFRYVLKWLLAIVAAAFAVLFFYVTIHAFTTQRVNGGWPIRYGITLGESGLALRLADVSREIAWSEIIGVKAVVLQLKKSQTSVIRLSWVEVDGSARRKVMHSSIGIDLIDVSPRMLHTALLYYWRTPAARAELGNTVAQRRMEWWAAQR